MNFGETGSGTVGMVVDEIGMAADTTVALDAVVGVIVGTAPGINLDMLVGEVADYFSDRP